MALATPNFFDEFKRIRTHAAPYDPNKDYQLIISQLKEACEENNYLGTSPHNLVEPAELLPVIIIRQNEKLRTFINPRIIGVKGGRLQYDACGNIFLLHEGKKVHAAVLIRRPRYVNLEYISESGYLTREWFVDPLRNSKMQSMVGAICHESAHLRGELILDNARQRLINILEVLPKQIKKNPELAEEFIHMAVGQMPFVLIRKGDTYVFRHGSELGNRIPKVSPDALFFDDPGLPFEQFWEAKVPRGGELLPIRPSRMVKKFYM